MRKRMMWLILILVAASIFALAIANRREPMWDYDFVAVENPRDMQSLYDLGEQGWEVTGVFKHWRGQQAVLLKRKH